MPQTPHVLAKFYGSPWAILPSKFREIEAVLMRRNPRVNVQLEHFLNEPKPPAKPGASMFGGSDEDPGYTISGNTAVIRIHGTITPRSSIFEEFSGGTSHMAIGHATDAAIADPKVEGILYDIDSPGGVVYGIPETAAKVLAAGKSKPTYAIANHVAASAGYWYLAQAGKAYVTPAGEVGCIGVIMANVDETEANKAEGVRYDLVSNDQSPFKTEGYPQVPVTPAGIDHLRQTCNAYATMFYNAVAKGRNRKSQTVARDFGQGRTLIADDALAAGMVDEITTLEELVTALTKANSRASRRSVAAQLVASRLPTA